MSEQKINEIFDAILADGGSHLDFANLFALTTKEIFKCVSPKNKTVYYYKIGRAHV